MAVINDYDKFLGVLSIILAIVGTIGNLTGIFVCLQPSLRRLPTFVFMIFILLMDTIPLYLSNLDVAYAAFNSQALENRNIVACKAFVISSYTSQQASALLTVSYILKS